MENSTTSLTDYERCELRIKCYELALDKSISQDPHLLDTTVAKLAESIYDFVIKVKQ